MQLGVAVGLVAPPGAALPGQVLQASVPAAVQVGADIDQRIHSVRAAWA